MSLAATITKNTIFQIIGKAGGSLLGLATIALMTRYLGRDGFGYYTATVSYLQFFGVLIDFGLQMTTAQLLSHPGADQGRIFGNILTLRLISSVVFLGGAAILVWFLPYPLAIKVGVGIASFSFFFISLMSVLIGLFQKHLALAEVALGEVLGRFCLLVGVFAFVSLDLGFYPLVAAVSFGSLANFLFLYAKSQKYIRYKLRLDKQTALQVWRVSWPLAVTISLTLVYFRADTIILSFVRPIGDVGIYGAAYKVLEILIQFPYMFLGMILPLLTAAYPGALGVFRQIVQKTFDFLAVIAVPMVMGTWLLADKIVVFVAGNSFLPAGAPLRVLIVAAALIFFGSLFSYAIVGAGLQKKMIGFYLFDAVFSFVAYIVFIPFYGYMAAAILTVMTEAIITFCAYFLLNQETGFKLEWGVFFRSIVAALIMSVILWLLLGANLATLVIIGIITYFVALYLIGGVKKNDLRELFSI